MKHFIVFLISVIGISMLSCTTENQSSQTAIEEDGFNSTQQDSIDFLNANGKLSPEILWKFGRVSDLQYSEDHQKILFGIKKYNLHENSGLNKAYVYDIETKDITELNLSESSVWNVRWIPNSDKIAFLTADAEKGAQIWEAALDGTNTKMISHIDGDINGFRFSPDGKSILFIKDVKLDKDEHDIYPDLPEAHARIINEMMYRHWDQWHDYAFSHIFVATVNNGEIHDAKDIMEGERFDCPMKPWGGLEQINWSPDGSKIAYCCKKMTGREYATRTNSEIYIYDVNTGETSCLTEEGFEGYDHDPVFSNNGEMLAWKSMEEDGFEADKERIMLHNFNTGENIDLSEGFDQSSSNFAFTKDDQYLYFISGHWATYQIYKVNIRTREISQITKGWHNVQDYQLAGNVAYALQMSMSMPTEVFEINLENGSEENISHVNDWIYEKITMGNVQKRWIKTTDGKDMLTWVIYPPDFDSTKQYPALLYCQGGPQSAVSQFFSFRWNFQIMAANGYIIVAPNRRGLPTFGQEWNNQISGDYGGQNQLDYLSAIDALKQESYIDENRLGAVGASYGGYSVFWLAGHHQGRFKALIAHCGIYNFESMYGSTEEYFFVNKEYEGPYWEKPKPKSYTFSPHLYVDKWDAPIMIVTGENDFRIPYTQSLEAFNAAQLRGVPSKLLVFPEESHFVLQPQNAVLWQREFFNWLDKWLK